MNELMSNALAGISILAPLILIAVELLKRSGIDKRWLPHVSVLTGALVGAAMAYVGNGDMAAFTIAGIIGGAAASGIYDLGRSTIAAIKERE